jgi:Type IV secretion system pilin
MKISNTLKKTGFGLVVPLIFMASAPVFAITTTPDGQPATTSQSSSSQTAQNQAKDQAIQKKLAKNPIIVDIQDIVNFLSAGVGVVVVGMIMLGGIQYSMAGDNAQKTAEARKRIAHAVVALVAFIFLFAFAQWIIPGGVFS